MESSERDDTPVLITDAAPSQNDQLAERKRRYITMMLMRVPFLIAAVLFHDPWWVAVIILVVSVPLPWMAVLIANDRPPRKAEDVNRYQPPTEGPKRIEHTGHEVIEG